MKKRYQRKEKSIEELMDGILSGDRVTLAQAITLVESNSIRHFEKAQALIQAILPYRKKTIRIGITGVPGAGKSTFIDTFGTYLTEQNLKVAVLAVDPSSKVSKGSILGDKTRMERLSRNQNAFIRPSPSGGTLGGVSRKTRETLLLCEAAGYDVILVETVGVGQGEFVVRSMVDFFLLIVLTGAGDELQTMKKGIMELPDLVVVNKADGDNISKAEKAKNEFNTILHFLKSYTEGWETKAVTASALKETGISDIWKIIQQFQETTEKTGVFEKRRKEQQLEWMHEMIKEQLERMFYEHPEIKEILPIYEQEVISGQKTVASTVLQLVNRFSNR
ncbi:methylmalonyl Co-A mutase-associated GTPase MeaB [Bacillus alveayuensis]|jgi:LAO/AO transport system kinase|uniref:LAO/AO transport system kinase n=1 Tax=Aeribacillus alveayuensis TaxID=279215 RepID=A0ABT9VKN4_9BACI|nr:methylmalonyl Co-A mutase-associated GTPase MeaB [Bacillus alveayuensis]MDQ0161420.1 LAO/AO transport system kinase [Bacillus alveayuensis]